MALFYLLIEFLFCLNTFLLLLQYDERNSTNVFDLEWCNAEYGCTAGTTCYNDLAFIEQLIQDLQSRYNIDPNHIHITGKMFKI